MPDNHVPMLKHNHDVDTAPPIYSINDKEQCLVCMTIQVQQLRSQAEMETRKLISILLTELKRRAVEPRSKLIVPIAPTHRKL